MKFWQALTWVETDQLVEVASIAEELGFDGAFVSDHLFVAQNPRWPHPDRADERPAFTTTTEYPDVWVALGAIAAATSRLLLTMSVYVLPLHHPIEVARAAATLSVVSGGRFALGIGAGWEREEFAALDVDFTTRGARVDESIEVMRRLWQPGWAQHHGAHFSFPAVQQNPPPAAPVPIWVGGPSAVARRRAARVGDGWIGGGNAPEEVPALLTELADLRRAFGREHQPFETLIGLTTPPDLDTFKRLDDLGMTSGVSYPFRYTLPGPSSVAEKRARMEAFAETIIEPMRSR